MKKASFLTSVLIVLAILSGCDGKRYRHMEGAVWNTSYHITYNSAANLDDSVRAVMRRVELSLSPFNSVSLISAVNRGEDVRCDSLLRKVMACSQQVNLLSGGLYDPTLAPLINLWGFGYTQRDSMPSDAEIAEALESVGINDCRIDDDGKIIRKSDGTEFNFSSITKGLACDEVGAMLRRNGCTDYMVEIGGEMALAGVSDRGRKWRIGVEAPREGLAPQSPEVVSLLEISDCGVATSGNYRNYRKNGEGKSFGHTISARTGRPVETSTLSATVVAPDCMLADALATAVMAMEPDSVKTMAAGLSGVWIMLVTASPEGEFVIQEYGARP
ncbi:MAG: FAD:protein FMN transferase [Muribaculaceae bacterium]|nr:FAD:protein FMN transferase [Muribaculaceae bacterium]